MSATPTPLPFRPFRLRGNTRFRKTRHSANRPPRQRRSRLAATRRVVLLGPFGEPLTTPTGVGMELPFRFSTKYADAETGLYSYIFRPYDPLTGRWLSRDPIEEEGGANLYGYVANTPTNAFDPFGMVGSGVVPTADGWIDGWTGQRGTYTGTGGRPDSLNRPGNALEKAFWRVGTGLFGNNSNLAKKLLKHFMDASGETLILTKDEMSDVQPHLDIREGTGWSEYIQQLHRGGPVKVKNMWIKGSALEPGTLGQFYGIVDGTFCGDSVHWLFFGKVRYLDYWDFTLGTPKDVPMPPIPNNPMWENDRTQSGTWKADVAHQNMPGKGFIVKSKKVGVSADATHPDLILGGISTGVGFGD